MISGTPHHGCLFRLVAQGRASGTRGRLGFGAGLSCAEAGKGSSGGSTERWGILRSSQAGSHQLALPNRCMDAGTRMVRRTKASRATAADRPMPNSAIVRWPPKTKAMKTQTMMAEAAVMTRAVSTWPTRTERALSLVCTHSSCIRLTRNTW